jgi:beta-lactamase regulating signal transducer with metallopeptidase domain
VETLVHSRGVYFLVELFLKSSLILALTLVLCFLFRKRPASFKHLLLVIALLGLLVLPFLMAFAPGWQTSILPSSWARPAENITIHKKLDAAAGNPVLPGQIKEESLDSGIAPAKGSEDLEGSLQEIGKNYPAFLFSTPEDFFRYCVIILWPAGLMFLLLKLFLGLYGTVRLTHQGVTMDGYPWKQLFLLFLSKTPLRKKVRLLSNNQVVVPMTWGVINPVVILPAESHLWPLDQCSSVLFHELSHIKRGDFLVRLLAKILCSFYWFNPLCWIVFRKLKREQEKACDEMVLKTGIKPSTYASYLLQMKKSIKRKHYIPAAAIGMAGQSEFKDRLLSILKQQIKIKEVKMKTKIMFFIIGVLAVTLIGTGRPSQSQTTFYLDNGSENAIDSQCSESVEAEEEVKNVSIKVDTGAEEKEEKKGKEDKDKKKKKERVNVSLNLKVKDAGKGKKLVKEVVVIPAGTDFHIKELEGDEENVIVAGSGDVYMILKEKGKLKKVKVDKGKMFIGETGETTTIYVKPDVRAKVKGKVVKIIADRMQMNIKKGHHHEVIVGSELKMKELEEHMKEIYGALKVIEKGKLKANEVLEKRRESLEKIKDKELKEKMKHMVESIASELHAKEAAREKALIKMGKALEKMEKELERKKACENEVHFLLEEAEVADQELIEIDEEGDEVIEIKEVDVGDGNSVVISEEVMEGKGVYRGFIFETKLSEKQVYELMKAVSQLKKKLPKCYKVESKISSTLQKVLIISDEEPDKKDVKRALKAFEVFEREYKKIFGEKKGKKD